MNIREKSESDAFATTAGELTITFLGHASLRLQFQDKTWYADPFHEVADFSTQPQADVILITHPHLDHFDPLALDAIQKAGTIIVIPPTLASKLPAATVMRNGDESVIARVQVEAVAMYNLVHMRETGKPYHTAGEGNGYVLTFGNKRVYIAGDTENIPEMKALRDIDIAFLPVNVPYTMTPEMAADAARSFQPRILYPYHYGQTDLFRLVDLLKDQKGIEIRIRRMA
jgi:L-ascorbate metabolism protein UlaG (beta-lactamase superfamily)